MTRVLGIDPGLNITGYGVIEPCGRSVRVLDAGVIRFAPRTGIPARLVELERELEVLFREHRPDLCAVEQLYAHYAHPRTAILMGHARGVILLVAARHGARIRELLPTRIKRSIAAYGHASKLQMQKAVQAALQLPERPEPADVADALAAALCCWHETRAAS